jgi:all-trans-retinol 13,14-reductase
MHSLLYGVSPENASVTLNAQVAGSYYHSVHGITGGGRALVDALSGLLLAAGGEIRCSAAVTALCANSGAVSGVQLASGELLAAKEVVSTMNPRLLPQLLPTGVLSPAYRKRMVNLRQTPSAYIVFAKSPEPLDFLRYRNLFVYPRAELFDHDLKRPLAERGFYLAGADQGRAGGIEGLIGIVPASYAEVAEWGAAGMRRSEAYLKHKQSITEQLMKMFSKSHPELAELEVLELATPLTLRDYSLAPEGSIYGVGRFLGQYNPHPATRLSGLFLSGQAVAAPGLLGAVVAGYLTCGTILGHASLRGGIRSCC